MEQPYPVKTSMAFSISVFTSCYLYSPFNSDFLLVSENFMLPTPIIFLLDTGIVHSILCVLANANVIVSML